MWADRSNPRFTTLLVAVTCVGWGFSILVSAADHVVTNFAQLASAVAVAVDGDSITLDSNVPFIATSTLLINKSVTIRSAPGRNPTIDMTDLYDLIADGKPGGTTQTWVGPVTIRSTKPKTGSVLNCFCTAGNLILDLYDITFVGRTASERRRTNGLGATSNNALYRLVVECHRCIAYGTSNQGFGTRTSPARTDAFDYVQLTLYDCIAFDNDEEGVSGHAGTTIRSFRGQFHDNEEYPSAPGTFCVQTESESTLVTGTSTALPGNDGNGLLSISEGTTVIHERCTARHTRGQAVLNHSFRIGSFTTRPSYFTASGCDINIEEDVGALLANGQSHILFEDCRIRFTGDYRRIGSSAIVLANSSFNSTLVFSRCVIDFSGVTPTAGGATPVFSFGGFANSVRFEGCVIIAPPASFWGGANATLFSFIPGFGTADIRHCTIVGPGSGTGVHLTGNGVTLRGNIFDGWGSAIVCNSPAYYDATSGWNVFHANVSNVSGGSLRAGDVVGNPNFLNPALRDYRLGAGSVGNLLDPQSARQIQSHHLNLHVVGLGSVLRWPDGQGPWPGPTDAGAYTNPTVAVTCAAVPDGAGFCGWWGTVFDRTNPIVLTLDRDYELSARFSDPCCDPCDLNCDGTISAFDIQPFVNQLAGRPAQCSPCAGDIDGNGTLNTFDLNGFLVCVGF